MTRVITAMLRVSFIGRGAVGKGDQLVVYTEKSLYWRGSGQELVRK